VKRILGVTLILALATPAGAVEYETFIDVDNSDELYELMVSGEISEDTFNSLLEVWERGVDLNSASREDLYALPNLTYADCDAIIAFRGAAGGIKDPTELVSSGTLSQEKLLAISSFLVIPRIGKHYPASLALHAPMVWSPVDDTAPAGAVRMRGSAFGRLSFGAAPMLTRQRLGDVVYDPNRDALSAEAPSAQLHLPKWFIGWDTPDYGIIVGTYRAGFGQRLTFDTTDRQTPNGFYVDDAVMRSTSLTRACSETAGELTDSPCETTRYVTPDFRWREGMRGVAAGARHLTAGEGWLQVYGFFSAETRGIYQYELVDRNRCDDPRDDGNDS
jgi:hypothetical protein